jgi:hypothetical protein
LTDLFAALLRVHLACAFGATAVFWAAGVSDKGGRVHRAAGRWFARLIYAAAWTGGLMAVASIVAPSWVQPADPSQSLEAARLNRQTMWLVLYVLVIIVAPVQHGLAVVAAADRPSRVRSRLHATLNIAGMLGTVALLAATIAWQQWIFLVVTPIGFVVGVRNLTYTSRSSAMPREWEREHLTSMITAGITLHTAFFVFGTSRSLGWNLEGAASLIPWVAPALVGLPLILWLRTKSRLRNERL